MCVQRIVCVCDELEDRVCKAEYPPIAKLLPDRYWRDELINEVFNFRPTQPVGKAIG